MTTDSPAWHRSRRPPRRRVSAFVASWHYTVLCHRHSLPVSHKVLANEVRLSGMNVIHNRSTDHEHYWPTTLQRQQRTVPNYRPSAHHLRLNYSHADPAPASSVPSDCAQPTVVVRGGRTGKKRVLRSLLCCFAARPTTSSNGQHEANGTADGAYKAGADAADAASHPTRSTIYSPKVESPILLAQISSRRARSSCSPHCGRATRRRSV